MDIHPKKGQREPSQSTRNMDQDPAETTAATTASHIFQTGDAGQIQPLGWTGNGSKTSEYYAASVGECYEVEEGKLPPVSRCVNRLPHYQDVSAEVRGRGRTNETVTAGSSQAAGGSQVSAVKLQPSGEHIVLPQVTERLEKPQASSAVDPLNPDPVHLSLTSPRLEDDSPVISFTIPPTEEDMKQLQSGPDKNGHIKRPPNAFIVWSSIHRWALRKSCPGAHMTDVSILLGCEWSKLSDEQKRPYYEMARKLQYVHRQQFPDYEFHPQRKKDTECLSSEQGAGQDPGVSFSQAMPPAHSELHGPRMDPYPSMMLCRVGYYPYSPFFHCHQTGLYPRVQIHRSRYPNASSSTEEVRNYHKTHETASKSLKQPYIFTSQQLLANSKVESKCGDDDDVDVVVVGQI
ncbi:uncharacterized protein LOC115019179 [Cottoperca gobio]|uniref:Uncharacterized protein LOC115019179 n=1 Tax=Cottoperca gobio TaxID=56716 RepID=A0A6J2R145_COTGO|nr:uncharacterized protein LOC115019179 [Cottoperca gobio]